MNVMQTPMTEALRRWRIIPVIVIEDTKNALPLAAALLAGGLPIAEITLRTKSALESLRRIKGEQPEMFAGAGTVLNVAQAKLAKEAGAEFVVSPGLNRASDDVSTVPAMSMPALVGNLRMILPVPLCDSASL